MDNTFRVCFWLISLGLILVTNRIEVRIGGLNISGTLSYFAGCLMGLSFIPNRSTTED